MKEHYVSYEQAVALKRLGFAEKVNHAYLKKISIEPEVSVGDLKEVYSKCPKNFNDNRKGAEKGLFFCSAPRLDQAAAWMREEKGVIVWISPEFYEGDAVEDVKWYFYTQPLQNLRKQRGGKVEGRYYDSYESALSAGLDVALELLGKEVNNA